MHSYYLTIHLDARDLLISLEAVVNENVIGSLKGFKIINDQYRNRRKRFGLRFNLIAGMHNMELNHARKQRVTVQISEDVIERIKNAACWTPGLTLASLAEEAFSKVVDTLEDERKSPFPKRKGKLKIGRSSN